MTFTHAHITASARLAYWHSATNCATVTVRVIRCRHQHSQPVAQFAMATTCRRHVRIQAKAYLGVFVIND